MSKEYCKEKVLGSTGWRQHRCNKLAKKDGYCTIHHPDYIKAKAEKARAKYERQKENSIYARYQRLQKENADLKAQLKHLEQES